MASGNETSAERAPAAGGHWLDGERLRVYPLLVLAIFTVTAVWWTARSLPDLVDPEGKPVGYDFIAFWSAARLAWEGHPAAAFDWSAMAAMHHAAVPHLHDKLFLWHYPPTYLLVVLPLGLLPYPAALVLFLAATAALWALLVRRILPDRRAWLAAAALPAGLVNIMHGQNGFLTAACAGFALLALDRRPLRAGIWIAFLAIKPHLAILFPVALAAEGRWRAFAAAALATGVFCGAAVAAFGWPTVAAFLHDIPTVRPLVDDGNLPWGMMPSPYVFGLSLGLPAAAAMVLQVAVALAAAVCVWLAWRGPRAPFEAKAAVLAVASMLVSPYVFYYDLTWAGLAIAWLALLGLRDGFLRGERELLFAAWAMPFVMYPLAKATGVQIGFPLLAALLALATYRARLAGRAATGVPRDISAATADAGGPSRGFAQL